LVIDDCAAKGTRVKERNIYLFAVPIEDAAGLQGSILPYLLRRFCVIREAKL
jgi:hypothetical protein